MAWYIHRVLWRILCNERVYFI